MKQILIVTTTLALGSAWSGQTWAAAEAEAGTQLEEITVTAQRREESLQKAAVAVTALTSQVLTDAGITAQADLTRLVPSITVNSGGGGTTQASLRGVGNLAGNTYAEQAVAWSLDGVYIARGESVGGNFYDLERVEVLKGPQGTLYGRNASAGAINLISKKPVIGKFGGDLQVDVGNYSKLGVQAALNLPVSDNAALRIAGQRVRHDGYFNDGYNDQDETDGRLSWLWVPNDALSLRVGGDYSQLGGKGSAGSAIPGTGGFWDGPSSPGQQARWKTVGLIPVQSDGRLNIISKGVNAQVDWTTSLGTLTVLPAVRYSDENALHYAAGFPVDFAQSSRTQSLEARFSSSKEQRLSWIVGAYYFKEDASFDLAADQTLLRIQNNISLIDTKSTALFGQGTLTLTDNLRAVAGLRYTSEDKSTAGQTKTGPAVIFNTPLIPFQSLSNALKNTKTTWRAGLEYDVNSTSLLYLTAATGFKAGGFFASQDGVFQPETLTSYTLGSKNRFLDNRLQLNVEAYYWKYKDKQVSHLGFTKSGGIDLITENAGNATMYGIEPELTFLMTPKDLLSGSFQYEHAKYDEFVYITPAPPTGGGCKPSPATVGFSVDCSGFQVPNTPEWVANASYAHTFDLSNGGDVVATLSAHYRSSVVSGEEQTASEQIKSYTTEDFTLAYNFPNQQWSVTGYVYNLGDREIYGSSFFFDAVRLGPPFNASAGPIGPVALQNPPRTFGLRLSASF